MKSDHTTTTAPKSLEKAREQQRNLPRIDHPNITSQLVALSLSRNVTRKKLDSQWEPSYRIVGFPSKWTARVRNKESGEPKHCNIKDLKLKDPAEDWELKAECIGRAAKFVNHPSRLPDVDLLLNVDNSTTNLPDSDLAPEPDMEKEPNKVKTNDYNLRRNIKLSKKLDI